MVEESIGKKIRQLREERGMSRKRLADRVGFSYSYVNKVERGEESGNNANFLSRVASVLGVSADYFSPSTKESLPPRTLSDILGEANKKAEELETVEVPVLGSVPAGDLDLREEGVAVHYPVPRLWLGARPSERVYSLLIKGESLAGDGIHDGMYVLVEKDPEFINNKIYVVLVEGMSTVKHVVWMDGRVRLISSNTNYHEMEAKDIVIQGMVFRAFSSFEL